MARTKVRLFLAQSTPGRDCFKLIPTCGSARLGVGRGCGSKKTLIKTTDNKSDTTIVARLATAPNLVRSLLVSKFSVSNPSLYRSDYDIILAVINRNCKRNPSIKMAIY